MLNSNHPRGSAIIETTFLVPWIFFLFVGILDFGFYAYAAICTQNAARAVAMQKAADSTLEGTDCATALGELSHLPNANTLAVCAAQTALLTDGLPVSVCTVQLSSTAVPPCDPVIGASSRCADCDSTSESRSIQAVVSYRTLPFVPIPLLVPGRFTLTRVAEAKVAN